MMPILRLLFCAAFTLLLFASCETDLPLPAASTQQKIVLLGELSAGDTMLIRAGQSTAVAAGNTSQLIQNLQVSVEDDNGIRTGLIGVEDYLSYVFFTMPFSSSQTIASGRRYKVLARHPQLGEASATVQIPGAVMVKVGAVSFDTYNGDSVLRVDLELNDPAAANGWYVVEVLKQPLSVYGYFLFDGNEYSISDNQSLYDSLKAEHIPVAERYDTSYSGMYTRQQMYTADAASENLSQSVPGRLFKRIFLPGHAFGGASHNTQIFIPRSGIYPEYAQYAQTLIRVKSVAQDYYDFLKSYEQYEPTMGIGGNASPSKLQGNVIGGFGMVGGVYNWSLGVIY